MRIAFFADSYKPYISGVTVSIDILAKELRALKHTVYIFAPSYSKDYKDDAFTIRFPSLPTCYPGFRLAVPFAGRLPEVDIIHAHSPFQAGMLARFIAKKRKVPLVYTFHTLFTRYVHYAKFLPERFSKIVMVAYLREFCRRTDLIIAPSTLSRRVLLKWGVRNACEVVPTGIDLAEIGRSLCKTSKEIARKRFGLPQDAKVLVYLGRISKEKNLSFLLDAFTRLAPRDTRLLLIGGGPLLTELKKRALKNVVFAGELSHEDAVKSCLAGDIFIFASSTETQGLVLAEAKAVGLPIVALFAGGLVDTVRSGIDGYLVPREMGFFVAHIERLLNDNELRRKMGDAAKEDAAARFSSSAIAKRIESLYNSLAK